MITEKEIYDYMLLNFGNGEVNNFFLLLKDQNRPKKAKLALMNILLEVLYDTYFGDYNANSIVSVHDEKWLINSVNQDSFSDIIKKVPVISRIVRRRRYTNLPIIRGLYLRALCHKTGLDSDLVDGEHVNGRKGMTAALVGAGLILYLRGESIYA